MLIPFSSTANIFIKHVFMVFVHILFKRTTNISSFPTLFLPLRLSAVLSRRCTKRKKACWCMEQLAMEKLEQTQMAWRHVYDGKVYVLSERTATTVYLFSLAIVLFYSTNCKWVSEWDLRCECTIAHGLQYGVHTRRTGMRTNTFHTLWVYELRCVAKGLWKLSRSRKIMLVRLSTRQTKTFE